MKNRNCDGDRDFYRLSGEYGWDDDRGRVRDRDRDWYRDID